MGRRTGERCCVYRLHRAGTIAVAVLSVLAALCVVQASESLEPSSASGSGSGSEDRGGKSRSVQRCTYYTCVCASELHVGLRNTSVHSSTSMEVCLAPHLGQAVSRVFA